MADTRRPPNDGAAVDVADFIVRVLLVAFRLLAGVVRFIYLVSLILGRRVFSFVSDPRTHELVTRSLNFVTEFFREIYARVCRANMFRGKLSREG